MTTDEKDFLARWSRRKQAAREGLGEPEPEQPAVPAENAEPSAEMTPPADEAAYADVDFDALDYSSDYTRFMAGDVPEMVQRRALRALWRSDPVLANIDGLCDYDEDYTDAARAVETLVSSYRAGHGYRSDEEIAAMEAEDRAEGEARPEAETPAEEHASLAADDGSGDTSGTAEATGEPATSPRGDPTASS